MAPKRPPERPWAVELMRRLDGLLNVARGRALPASLRCRLALADWPPIAGAYVVGDPALPVAVCTLADGELMRRAASLPGVAIAGRVSTANLGIEKIVLNVTANPRIRFLLLCGRDSPLFRPGQTLRALCEQGVDANRRIVGAEGYLPVLRTVPFERIERFRRQVELVDRTGQTDVDVLAALTASLLRRSPGPFAAGPSGAGLPHGEAMPVDGAFRPIRPGGKRQPLLYDPKGYFVIALDRPSKDIVLRHYLPDNTPAHEMRGRSAEPMLLGLLREDLVSQLSHAGYLGAELAKAEAALRLGLRYEQDQPLRADS